MIDSKLLIDRKHALSIRKQCEVLEINRSGFYYEPKGEPHVNLEIMEIMDKHILEEPTAGVLTMQSMLEDRGIHIGYERVRRLMRLASIKRYMAAFFRQVKIGVLTLTLEKKAMKKSRFTEPQIIRMLQSQQEGKKVAEICREYGISEQTFYNWKSKYGGMSLSELQRVKELEAENARLKRIVADQQISIDILKEVNSKKW